MTKQTLALRKAATRRKVTLFPKKVVYPCPPQERRRMLWKAKKRRYRLKKRMRAKKPIAEIRTYEELILALRQHRNRLGLSQEELNDIAGFQGGYVNKLEIGYKEGGRGIGAMSLPTWLDALGVRLVLQPRSTEKA